MILMWSRGSGRAWRMGRSTMEWGAEPIIHQVWRTHGPSAAEAGQADDWSEQGKAKVTEPQGRWGIPQGLQVPA